MKDLELLVQHLKFLNRDVNKNELILWFNEKDIDYTHMTDLDMYIYYIEYHIKHNLLIN